MEDAARHRDLQEDLFLNQGQQVCGELQLGSAALLSLRVSSGWQDGELWAGTWILAAAEVSLSVLASSLAGGVGLWSPCSFQPQETPEAPWPSTFTL